MRNPHHDPARRGSDAGGAAEAHTSSFAAVVSEEDAARRLERFRAPSGAEPVTPPFAGASPRDLSYDVREPWPERVARWREDPRARVGLIGALALVSGFFWYQHSLDGADRALDARPAPAVGSTVTSAPEVLVVHVSGAVARPGIVEIPKGSRVADAVARAGGARDGADLDRLNLAAPLGDGERVHVAMPGEPDPPSAVGAGAGSGGGPLNVNTATPADLEALPGVGPAIAAAIVEERGRRPFESVDDLLRVSGIGRTRLEQLRDLVTV